MSLPDEEQGRGAVQQALGPQLQRMDQLLTAALSILGQGPIAIGKTRGLDQTVVHTVAGLYAKACKTFRAIQLACECGLAEDAFVLSRTLFEILVLIAFVLQRSSRERSQMYLAHLSMRQRKILSEFQKTKGLKRYVTKRLLKAVDDEIAESAKILGPKLVKGLSETYSGRSLKDTARLVGLERTYQLFYRHASAFGHGSDLTQHLSVADNQPPVLHVIPGPSENLRRVMVMSYSFLRTILVRINERMGLDQDTAIAAIPRELA